MAAFRQVLERARQRPRWSRCRPSRSRSRRASSSCSRGCRRPTPAASRICSPTCRLARRHDRHVSGAARDDSAEARARVPAGATSVRFASTSVRSSTARRSSGRHTHRHRPRRRSDAGRRSATRLGRSMSDLKAIVEALIFASPEPVTIKTLVKLLDSEPKEDIVAAIEELKQDYDAAGRAADRRGRRRLPDRHAARAARVGPPAVPRADDAEAVGGVARDAGRHRLQAAGHRAGDRRDSRREHRRRARHADRAEARQDRRPQAGRRPAVPVRHDARVPRRASA